MPQFSRALNLLATLIAVGLTLPAAVLGGFWWLLPSHVQAEFGLPSRGWMHGGYVVLLFIWLFNRWPDRGLAYVLDQEFFRFKFAALVACSVGYFYGLIYSMQMNGGGP